MSMSKRFQIPASPKDHQLFQAAARKMGLAAAEWARRILREEAESLLHAKSWDQLFTELRSHPGVDDWEIPKRQPVRRSLSKKDDWA